MSEQVETERGYLRSIGGVSLFYQAQIPKAHAGPVVLIIHGYGEHFRRYTHVVDAYRKAGFGVFGFDLRGHGQSGGRRGHVKRFDDYLDDVSTALRAIRERAPDAPTFLLGHSMGGLITFLYLAERAIDLVGAVISSPMMGFAVKIPFWKASLGTALSQIVPALTMASEVDAAVLSHDPTVGATYVADPLVHQVATARWFTEAKEAQARALVDASQIEQPVLVLQAGDDQIVEPDATKRFFGLINSSDKELIVYDGLYHELFNELEAEEIIEKSVTWMVDRSPTENSV